MHATILKNIPHQRHIFIGLSWCKCSRCLCVKWLKWKFSIIFGSSPLLSFFFYPNLVIIIYCSGHTRWCGCSGYHLLCHQLFVSHPFNTGTSIKVVTWLKRPLPGVCVFTEIKAERGQGERRSKWKVNKAADEGRVNDKCCLCVCACDWACVSVCCECVCAQYKQGCINDSG